jgi:hypothetical protein
LVEHRAQSCGVSENVGFVTREKASIVGTLEQAPPADRSICSLPLRKIGVKYRVWHESIA